MTITKTGTNLGQAFRLPPVTALMLYILIGYFTVLNAELVYVVNSQSQTLSRINTQTEIVQNSFAQLGNIPNKVVVDGEFLWCVNSGDNAVQKINRETGATLANILVAVGSNPWDAILHEGNLYVTGLFTGKVYRINTQTGLVTGNVNVGYAPEALCIAAGKLYISNAGNYAQDYAGSSVSVIDLASFSLLSTIPVNPNPQYLTMNGGLLHVSCTGNWASIAGSVCIIDPETDIVVQTIALGGTPGSIWIDTQGIAYVADSSGNNLYRYNADDYTIINGSQNPLSEGGSEVTGNQSMILVLSPNWGNNAMVKMLHPDLSNWKQFSVGMMPTDLKLGSTGSEVQEELIDKPFRVFTYPNPVKQGNLLNFTLEKALKGRICIYNLKGQFVLAEELKGDKMALATTDLANGCYFYRISGWDDVHQKHKRLSGKIVIVR